jgi:cytochrome c5
MLLKTYTPGPFALLLLAIVAMPGCADRNPSPPASTAGGQPATATSAVAQTSGAQLWSENCMRCHNLRSPETYSSTQWEVAVHHMRLRANLTGEETEKITAFLKSAN